MAELKANLDFKQGNKTRFRQAERAVKAVKDMIFEGKFKPGEPLSEVLLGEVLGMSRTPVREAINRLASEGLLKIIPGRGAIIAELTIEDFKEINDLRLVLEPLAAETSIKYLPNDEIERQKNIWKTFLEGLRRGENISPVVLSKADMDLHSSILDYCQNKRLKNFLKVLRSQIYQYLLVCWKFQEFSEDTISQHLDIIYCLEARNIEDLKNALRAHIMFNSRYILCNEAD